jgi:hypothetical protein
MSTNFFEKKCQSTSSKKLFGLCDDPAPPSNPAYIDEHDGSKWIAVVVNDYLFHVTFTAIDNCIELWRIDGKAAKRCEGMLNYNSTLIFVELKERSAGGNKWVLDAEEQLRSTISHFETDPDSEDYLFKKAYIANSGHPKFKSSQMGRMDKFFLDTGYVLRIENRIILT